MKKAQKNALFLDLLGFLCSFVLLNSKIDRYGVLRTNGFASLHAGLPFRHRFDHPNRLFVQERVSTGFDHFHIGNRTVFIDNKLRYHPALDTVFIGYYRIYDVFLEERGRRGMLYMGRY